MTVRGLRQERRSGGFTFLELLIILAFLCVAAVLLMPAAQDAREAALSAACKSNLHQLAFLCQSYAQREGYFPWGMIDPSTHDAAYWEGDGNKLVYPRENPLAHGVSAWCNYRTFCWDFRRTVFENAGWSCGEMFGDLSADSLMCCPKCRLAQSDNWDGNRMTGYNYNVCFLGRVENDSGTRRYPTRMDAVTQPARVVVFGDGGYAGGPNKFMRAPKQDKFYDNSNASLRKGGTQAFRHGRGRKRHCNMAFLDGHVEEFTRPFKAGGAPGWVDEETHSAFICSGNGIYGPRGFGENDDDEP